MKYKILVIILLLISFSITSLGVAKAQFNSKPLIPGNSDINSYLPGANFPSLGVNPTSLTKPSVMGSAVNGKTVIAFTPNILDTFSSTAKYNCNVSLYKDGTTSVKNLAYTIDNGIYNPKVPSSSYTVPTGTGGSFTTKTTCKPQVAGANITSPVSDPVIVKADGTVTNPASVAGPAAPAAPAASAATADPNAPSGTNAECSNQCNQNKLGWFNPGKEILDTVCQLQCTVISWIAGALANAFAHIVVPNLM